MGCAAGLAEPCLNAGVILANSELADEGARGVAGGRFLVQPGSYRIGGLEPVRQPSRPVEGRRSATPPSGVGNRVGSTAHVGATAGPISPADRVLLGNPDVLIVGVGGGSKIYDGGEAADLVKQPTQNE